MSGASLASRFGITPLALIGGALASGNTDGILEARIFDTLLGSVVAVVVFALSSNVVTLVRSRTWQAPDKPPVAGPALRPKATG
ncbi:hypothetical protein [Paenarthrobacter sp. YIM B13468]|uniref:hypothetical protein n=1 Tax=Paenarthrobacter sp. YIM B13468 TaxID=3366295 RepID=UPI00366B27C8